MCQIVLGPLIKSFTLLLFNVAGPQQMLTVTLNSAHLKIKMCFILHQWVMSFLIVSKAETEEKLNTIIFPLDQVKTNFAHSIKMLKYLSFKIFFCVCLFARGKSSLNL